MAKIVDDIISDGGDSMKSRSTAKEIVYFDRPGKDNTLETLQLAKKRAEELGIKAILVATTRGDSGVEAVKLFKDFRVIVVSHSYGSKAPDTNELEPANKSFIESNGGTVLTTTHAFAGVSRAIRKKLNTYQTPEIIAYALRTFGEGMKVVCEIALMAADSGLVKSTEEVVSIAGTGSGVDTAVVLKPANTNDYFELRVKEIICKPRL